MFTIKLDNLALVISLRARTYFQSIIESPFISDACTKLGHIWKDLNIIFFHKSIVAFIGEFFACYNNTYHHLNSPYSNPCNIL